MTHTFRILLLLIVSIVLFKATEAQSDKYFYPIDTVWVDSVMNSLSLDEKIAQIFSVRAYSNKDADYEKELVSLVKKYRVGGITFFQGGPARQAALTNRLQKVSDIPLLISIDAEWGLGMRLDSTISFPYQLTMGAISNDTLVYLISCQIASQLKRLGVHMNLAPVVDVNNNPENPVIHMRSFGEDKYNVASKGLAYMRGLQDNGILAVAKHFPGHGDTDMDSHYSLPLIPFTKQRLDTLELFPFKELIKNGVTGVMAAHLYIPALDSTNHLATTLSEPVITGLLKKELGFNGFVITDALDMQGVAGFYEPGEIELKALQAGNDILLLPQDIPAAIKTISKSVKKGVVEESIVDHACRKMLEIKSMTGAGNFKPLETSHIYTDLNNADSRRLNRIIYEQAITLVRNQGDLLPLNHTDTLKIASIAIGVQHVTPFQDMLQNYASVDHYYISGEIPGATAKSILNKMEAYNLVIISIHNTSHNPRVNFGISSAMIDFISALQKSRSVVLNILGSPYILSVIPGLDNMASVLVSYQDNINSQEVSAQMIFGSLGFSGHLPVTASEEYPLSTGIITEPEGKVRYIIPEQLHIVSADLDTIDHFIMKSIEDHVFPGCQVVAMKDGQVFYQKSFGYHTYQKQLPVLNTDLYDLASITKIAATTLAVMRLYKEGRIDIDQRVVNYLPYLRGTNKEKVIIREMMAHQAGFQPWIPFYKNTLLDGNPDPNLFSNTISEIYPTRVARDLYIHRDYIYTLFDSIIVSAPLEKKEYKYSDLPFYLLYRIIENVTNRPFGEYLRKTFYTPMGLYSMCFRPYERFRLDMIVPTEDDKYFRKQLIHGDVHDPGAAMTGGVAGHAGLFSNANDLAVLMNMLLQGGVYANSVYLDPNIIKEFTSCQFPLQDNRRGIGFDKPLLVYEKDGPACRGASPASFGHSGFTGTYTWADPENGLVYVFLSNRVHPDASNIKIQERNIRTRVHQMFYDLLMK